MTVEERIAAAEQHKEEGNALFKADKIEEAIRQYEMALGFMGDDFMFQMFGKYIAMANAVRFPCHLNLAACALKRGRYEDAISNCSVVLAEEPANVKALFRRGKARAALGQSDAAKKDLSQANKLAPSDKAVLKELQLLKESDRESLEVQKKLFKSMFASKSSPLPVEKKGPPPKVPWYRRFWIWVVQMLQRFWPFKSIDGKKKSN
eukprot:TRINITY_DN4234_c0_g1_i1.p1 TRINITY_DN4234_c0_g1~~TRINITY_DN4234_c0_g1_i1.p1  ORF type:complete len:206 (-),score=54.85 TRINITY_DN4234_c0_g1_i1:358-975(-)